MNTKLQALTEAQRRLISFFMKPGQESDGTCGAAILAGFSNFSYYPDWLREASQGKGMNICILGHKSLGIPIKQNKRSDRIELMLAKHKH